MTQNNSLLWLVRELDNRVHGPYSRQEMLQKIKSGKVRNKVELAQANSYWFAVTEKEELENFFPELSEGTNTGTGGEAKDVTVTSLTATQTMATDKTQEEDKPQWLSDEYAEDFGIDSLEPYEEEPPLQLQEVIEKKPVPIEVKEVKQKIISVPLDRTAEKKNPIVIWLAISLVLLLSGYFFWTNNTNSKNKSNLTVPLKSTDINNSILSNPLPIALRQAFLLHDMELIKQVIGEMEASTNKNVLLPIAKSLMRKYFLFDSEGAALILEGARSFLYEDNKKIEAEIENLNGIYIIDQEPMKAVAFFRSAVTLSPEDKIYSFNLGTALLVAGKAAEAEKILIELAKNHFSPSFLYPQLFMTIGLAAEVNRGLTDNTAEQFYKKALDFNPALVEARLLLAIRKLRRYGMKDAEIDFKIFLEIAPDVDANDTMVNYRLLSYPDIYGYSRSIMHQAGSINLGTAAQATSVYMAVDAVLSTIQNKYNEAERILEDALSRSPGNIDALKAMAYVRWKEGKFSELLDLLKDAYKDNQNSYAILLLIGRAYQKVGNYRQAEKFFKQAASVAPDFYKSWSLWGDILMHLGSEEDALKKYKTALEKNPFDLHAIQGSIQLGVNTILNDERFKELLPF